jgi:shikimate dehydrogenase
VKPLWLLGADIARSPSPAMHNAALVAMGQDPVYGLKPCGPDELGAVLDDLEKTARGANVTAPHKVAVARRYAAILDDDARATGAVNTLVFEEGRAIAAKNTDVAGLLFAWKRSALVVEGRTVAVVGAGGAARAAVVAAQQAGARGVVVHARRDDAAASLVALAASLGLEAIAASEPCGAQIAVLAATALDEPASWIARALDGPGAVHDLRYGAASHAARNAALAAGHLFVDGTLMLLAQGQAALAAFLGAPVPDAAAVAMRRALLQAIAAAPPGRLPGG